jgi:hypothetical protein
MGCRGGFAIVGAVAKLNTTLIWGVGLAVVAIAFVFLIVVLT